MPRKIYFQDGPLLVTSEFLKVRNRSIQLSTLESVEISRAIFFGALGSFGVLLLFAMAWGDLLYWSEILLFLALGGSVLYLAWNVGTFTTFSKLTGSKGWSVIGWMTTLRRMRSAVEVALEDQARRRPGRRHGGGVVDDHDDDEGADD